MCDTDCYKPSGESQDRNSQWRNSSESEPPEIPTPLFKAGDLSALTPILTALNMVSNWPLGNPYAAKFVAIQNKGGYIRPGNS